MSFEALIKVGGSICSQPELRTYARQWAAAAARRRLLFIAGGGIIADQIRMLAAGLKLGDSAAHWMAILAMDQSAYLLADCAPEAVLTHDLALAAQVAAAGHMAILAPSTLLRQTDPLPHSWQVTSDSLAAWLAGYAGIELLVLLKDVAGVFSEDPRRQQSSLLPEVVRTDLARFQVVDDYFRQALPANVTCWLLDGQQPERLLALLAKRRTLGTRITQS
jgi:5-(aminomethyl)-3-furanmethanol phosphate kinase